MGFTDLLEIASSLGSAPRNDSYDFKKGVITSGSGDEPIFRG